MSSAIETAVNDAWRMASGHAASTVASDALTSLQLFVEDDTARQRVGADVCCAAVAEIFSSAGEGITSVELRDFVDGEFERVPLRSFQQLADEKVRAQL